MLLHCFKDFDMQPISHGGQGSPNNSPAAGNGGASGQDQHVTVLVSGRPKHLSQSQLSYDEVVRLYAPEGPFGENHVYTVDYFNGPPQNPQGSLVSGQSVAIRSGMKFDVTRTDRS